MGKRWLVYCLFLSFGIFLLFPFVSAELNDGLVAYWNFDETNMQFYDYYDGFDGDYINGAMQGLPGVINNSYHFDGVQDYVAIDKRMEVYDAITFSFWINPEESTPNGNGIISKRSGKGYAGLEDDWQIALDNNKLTVAFWETEVPTHSIPFSRMNKWTHVVVSYDGEDVRIYLNGTKVYEEPNSGRLSEKGYGIRIGDDFWGNSFKGRIDEFGIWERALTDKEVYELYNGGNGTTYSGELHNSVEDRVSFLEYLTGVVFDTLQNISTKLDSHEKRIRTCESKITTCENKIIVLENRTKFLENNANKQLNITSSYLKYLSSSDRKAMVCGYAEDNKMKSYIDLGWNCTINYRTLSGRTTSTCNCKVLK